MASPLVSVVIPVYNDEKNIARSIQCILYQSYQNFELIIGDDCSTDNTVKVVEQFFDKRIRLFRNQKNRGPLRTRNFLFQQVKGDFITQIDSDDWSDPTRIEKQVQAFSKYPEIGGVGCNFYRMYQSGRFYIANDLKKDVFVTIQDKSYYFWPPSLMFRTELWNEVGEYPEYFVGIYGEDNYWINRLLLRYKALCLQEPLYGYYVHDKSLTNTLVSPRQFVVPELLNLLRKQMMEQGTDWLAEGEFSKLEDFEKTYLNNKKWLGEKYRVWAAKKVRDQDFRMALACLKKALKYNVFSVSTLKTIFYYLRAGSLRLLGMLGK